MSAAPQSFESHARMVTGYHYVGSLLLLVLLAYYAVTLVGDFSVDRLMLLLVVVQLGLVGFYARMFPLGVQDRLIRLEERLRLERLLSPELRPRIDELTTDQLIGLRFASDGEVEGLAVRVLDGELTGRKEIKAAVRQWRADHERI